MVEAGAGLQRSLDGSKISQRSHRRRCRHHHHLTIYSCRSIQPQQGEKEMEGKVKVKVAQNMLHSFAGCADSRVFCTRNCDDDDERGRLS